MTAKELSNKIIEILKEHSYYHDEGKGVKSQFKYLCEPAFELVAEEINAAIAERMPTECRTCNELGHPCWLHDPTNPDNNKRMPTNIEILQKFNEDFGAVKFPTKRTYWKIVMWTTDFFRSRMEEKK
jgi:hypothetical protein